MKKIINTVQEDGRELLDDFVESPWFGEEKETAVAITVQLSGEDAVKCR